MGLNKIVSTGAEPYSYSPTNPKSQPGNPNPSRFTLLDYFEYGRYLVLILKYKDCTNFEGRKILVYKDINFDPNQAVEIDPHFFPESKLIARFRPDDSGLREAYDYVRFMNDFK